MKIAVLGAGAMGALFGAYLSERNSVWLIDVSASRVDLLEREGVTIIEKSGRKRVFHPHAVTSCKDLPVMDLVIVFVKAMYTLDALEANKALIGPDTYLMTLQNGAGHEAKLLKYAKADRVIIGSTQHNSSITDAGALSHGGSGLTSIGLLEGPSGPFIEPIAATFYDCGLECLISDSVKAQIWKKLFTNTAASSLTGLLQVPLGFITSSSYAKSVMHHLAHEAVTVANAMGLGFDEAKVIADVEAVCDNAPNGYTSIYADLRDGRRTEVDTISGAVVEAAGNLGIEVPYHQMIVNLIHALEDKKEKSK
ncbi:MAG: 2-dehydropantoate 2-reductase [Sphaerochaetaceae bacterium]|jgi:2-dehydropantoate 2-reductase|nr:2-dehydropantoate 2-reductase [Sphaerochaetaceae bacterium]